MVVLNKRSKLWFSIIALSFFPVNAFALAGERNPDESDTGHDHIVLNHEERAALAPLAEAERESRQAHLAQKARESQDAPSEPLKLKQTSLSVAEAKQYLQVQDSEPFQAKIDGNRVVLSGFIYAKCWDEGHFRISHSFKKDGDRQELRFQVTDLDGKGRKCVEDEADLEARGYERQFHALESRPGASVILPDEKPDYVITLASKSPRTSEKVEQLIEHEGTTNFVKKEREKVRQNLISQISTCQKTFEDLTIAERALKGLRLAHLAADSEISKYEKEIKDRRDELAKEKWTAEVQALNEKIDEKDNYSKLEGLRRDVQRFAREHGDQESAKASATLLRKIALKYKNKKDASPKDFELAAETIGEAQKLRHLKDQAWQAQLSNDQRDIEVGKVQAIAKNGAQGNPALPYAYSGLMQELYADVQNSCPMMVPVMGPMGMTFAQNDGANMMDCMNAKQAMSVAQGIPQQAYQADMQRQQYLAQMQQQWMMQQQQMSMGGMAGMQMPGQMPQMMPQMQMPGQFPQMMPQMPGQMPNMMQPQMMSGQMQFGGQMMMGGQQMPNMMSVPMTPTWMNGANGNPTPLMRL